VIRLYKPPLLGGRKKEQERERAEKQKKRSREERITHIRGKQRVSFFDTFVTVKEKKRKTERKEAESRK
jgi:hypothetical protein